MSEDRFRIEDGRMTDKERAEDTQPTTIFVANDPANLKGELKALGDSQSDHWNNLLANQAVQTICSVPTTRQVLPAGDRGREGARGIPGKTGADQGLQVRSARSDLPVSVIGPSCAFRSYRLNFAMNSASLASILSASQ
jgi:hypothetical protein